MADSGDISAVAFAPVLSQQKPAAPFCQPIDLNWSLTVWRPFEQALVAETKKIGVKLAAATERQTSCDLSRVMPSPVPQRFEHQKLQFAALPHNAILSVFVSTLLFVKGNIQESHPNKGNSKSLHFAQRFAGKSLFSCSHLLLVERLCKQC